MSDPNKNEEEEKPDEWTVLADTYTSVLVPSFAPIYDAVAEVVGASNSSGKVLDFGCGPGEPTLTIVKKCPVVNVVGVDSTRPMLDIAAKRSNKVEDRVTFLHVRRDVNMAALAKTTGETFDMIVSSFVLHYVEFPRRVELVSQFLKMAPKLLLVTWGDQSKVGFLRAIKTFGSWKSDTSKDICELNLDPEDNDKVESPKGSFTLCREETFQGMVDQVEQGAQLASFETKSIPLQFSSVKALLSFLPMPTDDDDVQAMWKLLKSWESDQVTLGDGPNQAITFPTDVVFCEIAPSVKRSNEREKDEASKRLKSDDN